MNNSILSYLDFNIRSLNKNFDKLKFFINNKKIKPNCICLTETWLNESNNKNLDIYGYELIQYKIKNVVVVSLYILTYH